MPCVKYSLEKSAFSSFFFRAERNKLMDVKMIKRVSTIWQMLDRNEVLLARETFAFS